MQAVLQSRHEKFRLDNAEAIRHLNTRRFELAQEEVALKAKKLELSFLQSKVPTWIDPQDARRVRMCVRACVCVCVCVCVYVCVYLCLFVSICMALSWCFFVVDVVVFLLLDCALSFSPHLRTRVYKDCLPSAPPGFGFFD
jgi:hypothetical protein